MSDNPYAAPTAPTELSRQGATAPKSYQLATQNQRLVNVIVDGIAIRVFGFLIGTMAGIAMLARHGGEVTEADLRQLEAQFNAISLPLGFVIFLLYYIVFEGCFQFTLAKLLTKTRVVNARGGRARFGQIVGRSLARLIPFEAFSFLSGKRPSGWHDDMSGTCVIDLRKVDPTSESIVD